jgi:hypothetical protein
LAGSASGAVIINEFVASNATGLTDEDGSTSDWIEIYNNGGSSVGLSGWGLSDDPTEPFKWIFPAVNIGAGQYLVVFASNQDRRPTSGQLHTNFKLARKGSFLALVDSNGTPQGTVFNPQYPEQQTDYSLGTKSGQSNFWYYDTPTPGSANAGTSASGFAAPPTFSAPGGAITANFSLTLSTTTPSATIRHTINGGAPTPSDSSSTTFTVFSSSTKRVQARTYASGLFPSEVAAQYYFGLAADVQNFDSNLPIVIVDTFGSAVPPRSSSTLGASAFIAFDTDPGTGRANTNAAPSLVKRSGIRVRGNSTQSYPKKQYKFETWDEEDLEDDVAFLGMPKESDWVLHAPYSDKTLMRNHMVYGWWRDVMGRYGVRRRFVEVFVNQDGDNVSMADYRGLYLLLEKIKTGDNRVDVAKLEPFHDSEPEVSGGYVFKHDWHAPGFDTNIYNDRVIYVDPKDTEITNAQETWLEGYFEEFETALSGSNFGDPLNGYAKYIDVGAFIDNQIMVEMTRNVDGYVLSTYFHKDRGGKVAMGPIWDFNGSLGGADYFQSYQTAGWHYEYSGFPEDNPNAFSWYERLLEDPEYLLKYADRWYELREGPFTWTSIENTIDANVTFLTDGGAGSNAVTRNFDEWDIDDNLWPNYWDNSHSGTVHMDYVNWMKTWIQGRLTWMDSQIATEYGAKPPLLYINGGLMNQGGDVQYGDTLTMALPGAKGAASGIYYTLDGADPHVPAGGTVTNTTLVAESASKKVWVATSDIGTTWRSDPAFNDGSWTSGSGGVGYEDSSGYEPFIDFDVKAAMHTQYTSAYIRIPFTTTTAAINAMDALKLKMRFDDGFVAYLNGAKVAEAFAPASPAWDSTATDSERESTAQVEYDITSAIGNLINGSNVLAIHGLNYETGSSDFLNSAELFSQVVTGGSNGVAPTALLYSSGITLSESTLVRARHFDGSNWSAMNQATFTIGAIGSALRITEIMYHPGDGGAEFVELQNTSGSAIDISGVTFSDGFTFTFPPNTVLDAGEYIVIVDSDDVGEFTAMYPGVPIGGTFSGKLDNGGERLTVMDGATVLDSVRYDDVGPWPTSADGLGYSLVLLDAGADPDDPAAWRASTNVNGSPGAAVSTAGIGQVVINEALTHTDLPSVDTIEFHNPTGGTVDIRGWFITDNRNVPKKAKVPATAAFNIAAGGFATLDENTFGLSPGVGLPGFFLSSTGDEGIYLYSADGSGNLTGYSHGFEFGAADNGVSFGRHVSSDGREHFVAQSALTFGWANAGPKIGPVVISEISYNPTSGIEYVELTNVSGSVVQLWDTSAGGDTNNTYKVNGIAYYFAPGSTIPANGGKILIANTVTPSTYDTPFGPFGGTAGLANGGESVTLQFPDTPNLFSVPYIDMDRIKYDDDSPWPNADGNGLVLKRINTSAFGNDPANWQAVLPSHVASPAEGYGGSAVWLDYAFTGTTLGTQANPLTTFTNALFAVSSGGSIKIKSNSAVKDTAWTGQLTKPVRIESQPAGIVRIGLLSAKTLAPQKSSAGATAAGNDTTDLYAALQALYAAAAAATHADETNTSAVILGRSIHEPVLPFTRSATGAQRAQSTSPLAVRLRGLPGIDPGTIRASAPRGASIAWRPVQEGDTSDLWVVVRPTDSWLVDDLVAVAADAFTLDGDTVEPAAFKFEIGSAEPSEPLWQPDYGEDFDASALNLSAESNDEAHVSLADSGASMDDAVADAVAIGPEAVYDVPQRVWLPLPIGAEANDVQLYYYHANGEGRGWYPAENVDGWLVPNSRQTLEVGGTTYLGYLVRHAAIVQLGPLPALEK